MKTIGMLLVTLLMVSKVGAGELKHPPFKKKKYDKGEVVMECEGKFILNESHQEIAVCIDPEKEKEFKDYDEKHRRHT